MYFTFFIDRRNFFWSFNQLSLKQICWLTIPVLEPDVSHTPIGLHFDWQAETPFFSSALFVLKIILKSFFPYFWFEPTDLQSDH